jgi:hypothetical protein
MICDIVSFFSRIDFTAIATIIMAIFTGCLWWSTKKLWKTTEKSIELTKQEIIANHPPKLRVHSVELQYGSIVSSGIGKAWKIQCFIDNIGGSAAIIKESNLTFKKMDFPPAILPFSEESQSLGEKTIANGGYDIGLLFLNLTDEVIVALRDKQASLAAVPAGYERLDIEFISDFYFFGYVDYLDDIGTMRRTAFCRQFNIKTKHFTKVEDEDYEYSY